MNDIDCSSRRSRLAITSWVRPNEYGSSAPHRAIVDGLGSVFGDDSSALNSPRIVPVNKSSLQPAQANTYGKDPELM